MTEGKIIDSHFVNCRGSVAEKEADRNGTIGIGKGISLPVLEFYEAEGVPVKIYEDGRSVPICRHLSERGVCNLGSDRKFMYCHLKTRA